MPIVTSSSKRALGLIGLTVAFVISACAQSYMMRTPAERALWEAAENGSPEAQRRVARSLLPDPAPGGSRGDPGHAAFWYQTACEQDYANAAVEFYEFAKEHRTRTGDGRYLGQALACLESAIDQGHQRAIVVGTQRAQTIEKNYERAFFLYSIMDGVDPEWADQRWSLVDRLPTGAPQRISQRAADWRASHRIKDEDDFLREQSAAR